LKQQMLSVFHHGKLVEDAALVGKILRILEKRRLRSQGVSETSATTSEVST